MKTRTSFLIVFMALVMAVSVLAQNGRGGMSGRNGNGQHDNRGGGALLTDDQKQELHDLISSMREAEATRDEIREAVDALFAEWGIERSDRDGRGGNSGNRPQLTDEQKAELKELRENMTADGATRDEIRAAVEALFADWGIEMPNWKEGRKSGRRGFNDPQLTDEQLEILKAKIAELREAEATREEIHAAIEALYAEWGLEMPERDGRWGELLTEEQQAELKALVQELKDSDATREEIKAAVDALFDEWGIERPDFDGRKGRDGKGKKGKSWMGDLTEEQRATIREMIQQMKENGATREEIREAVKAQLEEWGLGGEGDPEGAQNLRARKNIQATNAPNPFNPTTTITYALEEAGPVSVKVYNTQGRLIRTLVDADVSQGQHSVMWNGLNDKGEQVSSGMYFYKVTTATETTTERMMLMK